MTAPEPICDHDPVCRVSSHADLEAVPFEDALASTYCCQRTRCIDDAKAWVRAETGKDPVVVDLPTRRRTAAGS